MQLLSRITQTARRPWRAATAGGSAGREALVAALQRGFDWAYAKAVNGLPGLEGAEQLTAGYAARHAGADGAVAALIARQCGIAGAAGFMTGCGGFVSLPVAIPANLASALYIQVRLVAAIAHLRGHDLRSNEVRALVLACLTGSKAADTLKDAGVRLGTRMTRDAVGWVSPAIFKKFEHGARAKLIAATGAARVAHFGKLVPVVGGVVAGGFDVAMTRLIGRTADRVFTHASLSRTAGEGKVSLAPIGGEGGDPGLDPGETGEGAATGSNLPNRPHPSHR